MMWMVAGFLAAAALTGVLALALLSRADGQRPAFVLARQPARGPHSGRRIRRN